MPQRWIFLNICTGRQNSLFAFSLVLATWIQVHMCGELYLLYRCTSSSYCSFLMFSSFHPLAHSFFSYWALGIPISNLTLSSAHIKATAEGSSLFYIPVILSPSFLFFSSPPRLCIAASHSPAKALMLQKRTSKEVFTLFSFFFPSSHHSSRHLLALSVCRWSYI